MPGAASSNYDLVASLRVEGTASVTKAGTSAAKMGRAMDGAATKVTKAATATTKYSGAATASARSSNAAAKASNSFSLSTTKVGKSLARTVKLALATAVAYLSIASAAAAVGQSVRVFAQFESSMAAVQAVTSASTADMSAMTAAARDLGETTRFSASEAASGMEFLGRAGFEATEIVGAMPSVLNLAAAAQLGLGMAADITSNIMSAFNVHADDSGEVADKLAAAAASSNINVSQLGQAMKFAGPVASALGRSLSETAAAVGVLGDAGLGDIAGRGLRTTLSSLASLSDDARDALSRLGVTAEQVDPQVHSLSQIFGLLADRGLTATDAFRIFGNEGASVALTLANQSERLTELTGELDASHGAAQRMADVMENTLAGAGRRLRSTLESVQIELGQRMAPAVVDVVDRLRILVAENRDAAQSLGEVFGGAVTLAGDALFLLAENLAFVKAVGLTIGAVAAAVAISNWVVAVNAGTAAISRLWAVVLANPMGAALAGILLAVQGLDIAIGKWAENSVREMDRLTAASERIEDSFNETQKAIESLNTRTMGKRLDELSVSIGGLIDKQAELEKKRDDALDQIRLEEQRTIRMQGRIDILTDRYQDLNAQYQETTKELKSQQEENLNLSQAYVVLTLEQDKAASSAGGLADGLGTVGGASEDASTAIGKLNAELQEQELLSDVMKRFALDAEDAARAVDALLDTQRGDATEQEIIALVVQLRAAREEAERATTALTEEESLRAYIQNLNQATIAAREAAEAKAAFDAEIESSFDETLDDAFHQIALDFAEDHSEAAEDVGDTYITVLGNAANSFIDEMIDGSSSIGDSLKNVLGNVLRRAADDFINRMVAGLAKAGSDAEGPGGVGAGGGVPGVGGGGSLFGGSSFGQALGVVGIFAAAFELGSALLEESRRRRFGGIARVGGFSDGQQVNALAVGSSGGLSNADAIRMTRALQATLDGILGAIGGFTENLASLEINVRNDGEKFRATVGGQVLGIFESFEEAMEAAIVFAVSRAEFSGIGSAVAQAIERTTSNASLEELLENIEIGHAVDAVADGLTAAGAAFRRGLDGAQVEAREFFDRATTLGLDVGNSMRAALEPLLETGRELRSEILSLTSGGASDIGGRALQLVEDIESYNAALESQSEAIQREIDALREQAANPFAGGGGAGSFGAGNGSGTIVNLDRSFLELQHTVESLGGSVGTTVESVGGSALKLSDDLTMVGDRVDTLGERLDDGLSPAARDAAERADELEESLRLLEDQIAQSEIASALEGASNQILGSLIPAMQAWLGAGFLAGEQGRANAELQLARMRAEFLQLQQLGVLSERVTQIIARGIEQIEGQIASGNFGAPAGGGFSAPSTTGSHGGVEGRQARRGEIRDLLDDMERGLDLIGDAAGAIAAYRQETEALADEMRLLATFSEAEIARMIRLREERESLMAQSAELDLLETLARAIGDEETLAEVSKIRREIELADLELQIEALHEFGSLSGETYKRLLEMLGQAKEIGDDIAAAGALDDLRAAMLAIGDPVLLAERAVSDFRTAIDLLDDAFAEGSITQAEYRSQLKKVQDAAALAFGDDLLGFAERYFGQVKGFEEFRASLERSRFNIQLAQLKLQFELLVKMGALTKTVIEEIEAVFLFIDENMPDFDLPGSGATAVPSPFVPPIDPIQQDTQSALDSVAQSISDFVDKWSRDLVNGLAQRARELMADMAALEREINDAFEPIGSAGSVQDGGVSSLGDLRQGVLSAFGPDADIDNILANPAQVQQLAQSLGLIGTTFNDITAGNAMRTEQLREMLSLLAGLTDAEDVFAQARRGMIDDIIDSMSGGGSSLSSQLESLRSRIDDAREAMEILGASASEMAEFEAAAAASLDDFWERATAGIQSLIDQIELVQSGGAVTEGTVVEQRDQFRELVARAMSGDLDALQELEQAGRDLVSSGDAFFGSGGAGSALRQEVLDSLRAVRDAGLEPGQITDPVVGALGTSNDLLSEILTAIGSGSRPAANNNKPTGTASFSTAAGSSPSRPATVSDRIRVTRAESSRRRRAEEPGIAARAQGRDSVEPARSRLRQSERRKERAAAMMDRRLQRIEDLLGAQVSGTMQTAQASRESVNVLNAQRLDARRARKPSGRISE